MRDLYEEFRCEARVVFRGQTLHLNQIIARLSIEEIIPPRSACFGPQSIVTFEDRRERRQRFIDMIAAEFAHALTEALFKAQG